MKDNKTEGWELNSHDSKYDLPQYCPFCERPLHATYVYVGIFPYIHSDITLNCVCGKKYNFCFPYNKVMTSGYTVYDSSLYRKPEPKILCPFHNVLLEPIRLYGDTVFGDGTKKLQIRCPVCFYSERVIWEVKK